MLRRRVRTRSHFQPLPCYDGCNEVRVHSQSDHLGVHKGHADRVVVEEHAALPSELVELVDDGL